MRFPSGPSSWHDPDVPGVRDGRLGHLRDHRPLRERREQDFRVVSYKLRLICACSSLASPVFLGSHMAEYALAQGAQVFGSARWRSRTENIEHLRAKIELIDCDLRDIVSVRRLLAAASPSHVIHLAAQSLVGSSWHTPAETLATNTGCQINLLESIRELNISPRFLVIGASEEYGLVHSDEVPDRRDQPASPVVAVRGKQGSAGSHRLSLLQELRPADHPDSGGIFVGDLTPRRDYSDVRDIVRGYWMLLERGARARLLPRPLAREGDFRPGRPGAAAPVRRDGAGRGPPVEDSQGVPVADRDPLRADTHGPSRLLATANCVGPLLTKHGRAIERGRYRWHRCRCLPFHGHRSPFVGLLASVMASPARPPS